MQFIGRDLPLFTAKDSLIVKSLSKKRQQPINCRFGMQRTIAEAHFDTGRNYIAMIQGHKRYIIAPPNQCRHLGIRRTGPSARHSTVDWSDATQLDALQHAQALEVVLQPGDVLYVPALWFHYIVSLDTNIQCNSRGATPAKHVADLQECGFTIAVNDGNTTQFFPAVTVSQSSTVTPSVSYPVPASQSPQALQVAASSILSITTTCSSSPNPVMPDAQLQSPAAGQDVLSHAVVVLLSFACLGVLLCWRRGRLSPATMVYQYAAAPQRHQD